MSFIESYFKEFNDCLKRSVDKNCLKDLGEIVDILKRTKNTKEGIFLVGNGGSSAIAEHMAIDLTKNAGLKAQAFSGSPLLTTFANDYGYDLVFAKCIESFCQQGDVLFAISSSGNSINIVKACEYAKKVGMKLITLTGFGEDNQVRKLGDYNLWVDSKAFGFVELAHNLMIHCINDAIIGSTEYMIKG